MWHIGLLFKKQLGIHFVMKWIDEAHYANIKVKDC